MCPSILLRFGLVAQLGERTVRIRKVEGSIPFESTKKEGIAAGGAFFFAAAMRKEGFERQHSRKDCGREKNCCRHRVALL